MTEPSCRRDDVVGALDRVLASSRFARNERMSRFLRVLVERTLDGKAGELKESVIGVEVFGRLPEYDPKTDSIVRTEAARLRTRLIEYYAGEGAADPIAITVPKGAYVPAFERRADRPGPTAASDLRKWASVVGLTCALAATIGVVAWSYARAVVPARIAVVPLVNQSPDSDDYFADALTDEIIHNLSVIEGLEVRSRTSSFALKGKPRDVREFARQLQVDYVLEGSVLRDGERLRIDAQLIRARDDVPVWSGEYERRMSDVFNIQNEISIGIVNNLRLHLGRGRRRYETSVEAYNLYLRGDVLSYLVFPNTYHPGRELRPEERPVERFRAAIQAFEDAIAIDRTFAPAYAGLARTYALRSVQFPLDHPTDELVKMRAAADRAVSLDPWLPEAHDALAMSDARLGQWERAERSFSRAIELDPNQSMIRSDYGFWFLAVLGRHDEALEQLRAAARSDPLSQDLILTTALVLVSAGRYGEAASYCGRLAEASLCLARVRAGEGQFDETVRLLAPQSVTRNPLTRGLLGYAYAKTGRREEAEQRGSASHFANEQALIFAGLGDKDRTYEALKRMAELGPQRVGQYLNYPEFAWLRGEDRLRSFRQSVGLP
jgi:TolB-like protein/Flp pilus assembly protein TadD